ncbi:GntR family transcriptional regulator [Planococcus beigongshangi]|uniref:GntR family transcriptional regulator n=1 Tax=Planococcus beigongshangi TaxID=2782536 RepID=UPI00193B79F7|nr:GntR family transcriptional regulator [Planococcus beigongshangi]
MDLNKNLLVPLYHQVKNYLEEKILSEEWGVGHRLPTEKELAAQFSVSSITIKRAVHELVNEGLLYRQSGKGTFVIKKEEKNLSQLVSLKSESGENKHHPHKTLSFKKEKATKKIASIFEIKTNDPVYKIVRVKLEEEKPMALEYSYIPTDKFPDLDPKTFENDLLYNLFIKKYQMKLDKAKVYFSLVLAEKIEADILNVPVGEQLFVIERHTLTTDGKVIEYSQFVMKPDQTKYFVEIKI